MDDVPTRFSPEAEASFGENARADTAAAIDAKDLRKDYAGSFAVDGLSITVPQGCFFGFLGPNGAGKTTTIRMLTGLVAPHLRANQHLGNAIARGRIRSAASDRHCSR